MAKKRAAKKSTKRKPTQQPPSQLPAMVGPGVDYGNTFRFLLAGATDGDWRNAVASTDEAEVRDALAAVGISFSDPADFDNLVEACQHITALTDAWNRFDILRAALLGPGASGAA